MPVLNNKENNFILQRMVITDNSGTKGVDVKNLMREFVLTENIASHFGQGRIVFEDQNNIRERLDFQGDEKIFVSWKTGQTSTPRDQLFIIKNIKAITQTKENEIEEFAIEIIDSSFEPFMTISAIQKDWVDKTKNQIFADISEYYGIGIQLLSKSNETISYLANSDDILQMIEDICYKGSDPHILYVKNGELWLTDIDSLFEKKTGKALTSDSLVSNHNRGAIKSIVKMDVIDRKEVMDDGINGHKIFDFDCFEEVFDLLDEAVAKTDKSKAEKGLLNWRVNPECRYKEDVLLLDFVMFEMTYPDSEMNVGDRVSLKLKSTEYGSKGFSEYSGGGLVWEIRHAIDRNYIYHQSMAVVKEGA